jgi:FAD/FMN-containing dehydrogenase
MSVIELLRAAVGAQHVLTEAFDTAPFVTDWRKRYSGRALAVVRPADTAEVEAVMQACAQTRTPVVPQGGNTGLVGGATPDDSGTAIVLSLARLNRIRAIDTANDTLTAEAGCVLQAVQEAARAQQRLFPLSLAAEGSCTIGGNLSTNAGGTQVLRYGTTRDLVLGVEAVLPNGEVWSGLRGLRKDNTGYDLRGLLVGAEGTLGVVTAATLKLFALPRAQVTAFAAVPSLAAAVELLNLARSAADATLTGFEVMSDVCLQRVARELPQVRLPLAPNAPWFALIEISDHEDETHAVAVLEGVLQSALDRGVVQDAAVARSIAESRAMWRVREAIPEAHAKSGGNVKHDIALPVSAIPGFVAATDAALKREFAWIRPSVFGHLGDGNLHYNMGTVDGVPLSTAFAQQAQINRIVHDAVVAAGGSISAEHGLGQMKRDEIVRYKSAAEMAAMRAIKNALDPLGIMNPGKVL